MGARQHARVKTRWSRAYVVRDRTQLASLVGELITVVGNGHAQRTAARLDLSPAMLSQLLHERRGRISAETCRALSGGIYSIRQVQGRRGARPAIDRLLRLLNAAVTYPTQDEARADAYEEWCAERAERFIRRRGGRWEVGDDGPLLVRWSEQLGDDGALPLVDDAPSLSRGVEVLRRDDYRLLLMHVRQSSPAGGYLRAFEDFCQKSKVVPVRRLVALVRILEPLLEAGEGGLLERGWRDLDDRELSAFVYHGVMRERILLKRRPAQL